MGNHSITNIIEFRDNGYQYTITTYNTGEPTIEKVQLPVKVAVPVYNHQRL